VLVLVAGKKTDLEKIRAVYGWVVKKIRYVPWEFGVHGFKPYRATQVFERRFGDCKDTALLISTMLGMIDIECYPALIASSSSRPEEDFSLPLMSHFNHCIVYVPAAPGHGEIWLDGTASERSMTPLMPSDADALAAVIRPDGAELLRPPKAKAAEHVTSEKIVVRLALSARGGGMGVHGEALAEVEGKASGERTLYYRRYLSAREARHVGLADWYGRRYGRAEIVAPRQMKFSDLENLDEPVSYRFRVWLGRFMEMEPAGKEAWNIRSLEHPLRGLLGARFPKRLTEIASKSRRRTDLLLPCPWRDEREIRYILPEGTLVADVPPDSVLKCPFGRFEVSYRVGTDRKSVTMKKVIEISATRIPAREYAVWRDFARRVDREEQKSIRIGGIGVPILDANP